MGGSDENSKKISNYTTFASTSASAPAPASGSPLDALNFSTPYVVQPTQEHLATVVWLHERGEDGLTAGRLLEARLRLPNVKFICPTAPLRFLRPPFDQTRPYRAWFVVGAVSPDSPDDLMSLDTSAALVAGILSAEPPNVKLGIGGFSLGGSLALYAAVCYIRGDYAYGCQYPLERLSVVVSLSGWLHAKWRLDHLGPAAYLKGAALDVLICHGRDDNTVPNICALKTENALKECVVNKVLRRDFDGMGHYMTPEEMDVVRAFLINKLQLPNQA